MNPVIPKSSSTSRLDALAQPCPLRRKVLHLTRGSPGRLLREILEYQMVDSDITIVSLEGEENALKASNMGALSQRGEWRDEGWSKEIGYSELLDLILEADRVFVW